MELRILVAGSGGQGILFLGKLIALAGMREGYEVTWFPSYGAEMRGGTAHCTVIVSDQMIGSPVVRDVHVLVAMNEAARKRFVEKILPGGTLLYDASQGEAGTSPRGIRSIAVPALAISATHHDVRGANVVMMGAFVGVTRLVNLESVRSGLLEVSQGRKSEIVRRNEELLMRGYAFFEDKKGNHTGRQADPETH